MSRRATNGNQEEDRLNEMNNRLELLVRATENLLEERNRILANPHVGQPDSDITRRIAQFKPPTYDGSADPKKLENWIREFEKVFDVVGCPNIMKVTQVVFYLCDQADLWWSQNRDRLNGQVDFSWEAFVQVTRSKLYPVHLQKKLT